MPVKLTDLTDEVLKRAAARTTGKRRIGRILNSISKVKTLLNSPEVLDTKKRFQQFVEREARLEKMHPKVTRGRSRPQSAQAQADTATDPSSIGLERKLSDINNLLSIEFLEEGRDASRAVVLISTPLGVGTGFFVTPNIILTNHHVIDSTRVAEQSQIDIFDEKTRVEPDFPDDTLFLSPATFFYTDEDLDMTLIAVDDDPQCEHCGWLPLFKETGKILIGHPVNVIQHPGGMDKKIVVHNSALLDLEDNSGESNFCWYSADTEEGSSGSAVFNNRWEVIALHHKSVPATNKNGEILDINGKAMKKERVQSNPEMVKWIANEGIRISKVVASIENASFVSPAHTQLRDKMISLWQHPKALRPGIKQGWLA